MPATPNWLKRKLGIGGMVPLTNAKLLRNSVRIGRSLNCVGKVCAMRIAMACHDDNKASPADGAQTSECATRSLLAYASRLSRLRRIQVGPQASGKRIASPALPRARRIAVAVG